MLPVLHTPRLVLVPFAAEDLDGLHTLWTDEHVRRYLWDDLIISRERAAETLDAALAAAASSSLGHWTLRHAVDGPIVGDCGFRFVDDEIELLYSLHRSFWGQGLALEACRSALAYLWSATDCPGIIARADLPNTASIRLMERLGMSYVSLDGVLVKYVLKRPELSS